MTRINGKLLSVSDVSFAGNEVPLNWETQKQTSFIFGGRQYNCTRGFFGLGGLSQLKLQALFDALIEKRQAITYIDDRKLHR